MHSANALRSHLRGEHVQNVCGFSFIPTLVGCMGMDHQLLGEWGNSFVAPGLRKSESETKVRWGRNEIFWFRDRLQCATATLNGTNGGKVIDLFGVEDV